MYGIINDIFTDPCLTPGYTYIGITHKCYALDLTTPYDWSGAQARRERDWAHLASFETLVEHSALMEWIVTGKSSLNRSHNV